MNENYCGSGWWMLLVDAYPSEKIICSFGMMKFPTVSGQLKVVFQSNGKIIQSCSSQHQPARSVHFAKCNFGALHLNCVDQLRQLVSYNKEDSSLARM